MAGDPRIQGIAVPGAAAPGGHYAHAVVAGGWVFVSGQLPITPEGERLVGAPFDAQARQALANVEAALRGANSSPADLVQVRVYVDDIENWPRFNALYAAWIGDHRPARCVVPVPLLHYGLAVEIECLALVSASVGPSHAAELNR